MRAALKVASAFFWLTSWALFFAGSPAIAKRGLTVHVLDRTKRPVQSSVSFLINGTWIGVGETNEKGILVYPKACGDAVPVRAEPLDKNYFTPSPRLCSSSLTFTVRRRDDPIVAYFDEYDANRNGLLDRAEFANLAAATSLIDKVIPSAAVQIALTTQSGTSERIEGTYGTAYVIAQPLSTTTDLNKEANAAINRAKENGLLAVLAVDQPTVRALPEYMQVVEAYLRNMTTSNTTPTPTAKRVLDITAIEFAELDKNHDGWLSREELRAKK